MSDSRTSANTKPTKEVQTEKEKSSYAVEKVVRHQKRRREHSILFDGIAIGPERHDPTCKHISSTSGRQTGENNEKVSINVNLQGEGED